MYNNVLVAVHVSVDNVWYGLLYFCHEWGDRAKIFINDVVTTENHCQIASQVKQMLFSVIYTLFYLLQAIL